MAESRKRRSPEYEHQSALIRWSQQPSIRQRYPCLRLLYHIKNETRGATAAQVAIDKANGVKKGVPDLCLPVPRGSCHGLYIEMKAPGGRLRQEQRWWLYHLEGEGYRAAVCYGWEQAAQTITDYLEGR